jgi:hypothetical protein
VARWSKGEFREMKKVIWENAKITEIVESIGEINDRGVRGVPNSPIYAIVVNGDGKEYKVFLDDMKIRWLKTFIINPEILDKI